jgi:uncharacterized membrane protein
MPAAARPVEPAPAAGVLPANTGSFSMSYSQQPADQGHLTMAERSLYVLAGLILAASGAKPRPNLLLNVLALGAGGYLAWRGAEGTCPIKAAICDQSGSQRQIGA